MGLREKASGLKKVLPAVFLTLKDNETPIMAKVLAGVTVGYALSPIDLIPDFIPILGYLDDMILLPNTCRGRIRASVMTGQAAAGEFSPAACNYDRAGG